MNLYTKKLKYIILGLIVVVLYFGFVMNNRVEFYFVAVGVALLLIVLLFYVLGKLNDKESIKTIRNNWGGYYEKEIDYEYLEQQFDLLNGRSDKKYTLNDQTWNDLDMDEIFDNMDTTLTECGQTMLYKLLRSTLLSPKAIKTRSKILNYISKARDIRENIQLILLKFGTINRSYVLSAINRGIEYSPTYKIIAYTMPFVPFVAIAMMPFNLVAGVILFLAVFVVNFTLINKVKMNFMINQRTIHYIRNMIIAAEQLGKIQDDKLKRYLQTLKEDSEECYSLVKKTRGLSLVDNDPVGLSAYINILFLIETRAYFASVERIDRYSEQLLRIYKTLGKIDAYIAMASFIESCDGYCRPNFIEDKEIRVKDIIHPLLEEPISNSLEVADKGVLLTGSNMSGKSTFLRALALNAVLAQTIGICFAEEYNANIYKVMTSITRKDDLNDGKSYYLVEAELILDIINKVDDNITSLIVIDEIFRGTNTIERIQSSSNILKYLADRNAMVIVATHDLELNEIIEESFDKYYFSESVGSRGLEFDYKIKKGVVKATNAIKILRYLGYPTEITE